MRQLVDVSALDQMMVELENEMVRIANHHLYLAGEINQLRSIFKGEAWEEGEEVEENNVPSAGHQVIPPWRAGS